MSESPQPPTRREFVASASFLAASAALAHAAASTDSSPTADRNAALTRKLTVPTPASDTWPVLTRYDQDHLTRIAMPIGGIGTGAISIGGRGNLRDFELVNKSAKGYAPPNTFFALYAKPHGGGPAVARALEGPIDVTEFEGAHGLPVRNHNLPPFSQCTTAAAYPLAQVLHAAADVPLQVRTEAWKPMEPADADASGIPIAELRSVLITAIATPIVASVCVTLES